MQALAIGHAIEQRLHLVDPPLDPWPDRGCFHHLEEARSKAQRHHELGVGFDCTLEFGERGSAIVQVVANGISIQ